MENVTDNYLYTLLPDQDITGNMYMFCGRAFYLEFNMRLYGKMKMPRKMKKVLLGTRRERKRLGVK